MNQHIKPAQFAPVAPIHILEELQAKDPRSGSGSYHLFLAHHTVEHPQRFSDFVGRQQRAQQYSPITIIMDNSIVELGGAVDYDMIREAVSAVNPADGVSVIPVLPDVMGDGAGTRALSEEAYCRWVSNPIMPGRGFMLVAQGSTFRDFTATINHFFLNPNMSYNRIYWVGIPRWLGNQMGSRQKAVEYVRTVAPQVKIHLLGFQNNILDDILCAQMKGVCGIDSAVPIRYGKILTPMTEDKEIGPRGDWWDSGSLFPSSQINIANFRNWIAR